MGSQFGTNFDKLPDVPRVELLKPEKAAEILGISKGWLFELVSRGQLQPAYADESGHVQLFDPEDVEALRAARAANPPRAGRPRRRREQDDQLWWLLEAVEAVELAELWAAKLEGVRQDADSERCRQLLSQTRAVLASITSTRHQEVGGLDHGDHPKPVSRPPRGQQ